ncbi:MAG: transporter substrate-binding domain-containing protein [Clostridia bacterium]|nr:transporter substrate-binding domain-containing protein [Clostridia bacterium]
MKKFAKIFVAVLCVALIIALGCIALVACDKDDVNTLKVATNCEFDPFEMLDDNGNPTGIDMDIMAAIAKELGMKLKISDMLFDSVVGSVGSGACDVAAAGLTVDEERLETVDFTKSYFKSNQVVIAKNGDAILSLTDADAVSAMLEGKRLGAQKGTTGYKFISGDSDLYDGIKDAEAVGYDSGALAVDALKNGQIDYVIIDAVPAAKLAETNNGITVSSVILTDEDYAFAVKKGNTELLNKINAALDKLITNGTIEQIFQKYGLTSGLTA